MCVCVCVCVCVFVCVCVYETSHLSINAVGSVEIVTTNTCMLQRMLTTTGIAIFNLSTVSLHKLTVNTQRIFKQFKHVSPTVYNFHTLVP